MSKKELSGKDFLLSLLYCPGKGNKENEPILGRTRLTKMVFLFEKEIKKEFFSDIDITLPNFESHNFGPFSKDLFDDLSFFVSIGFIRAEETSIPISNVEKKEIEMALDDDWEDAGFEKAEQESVELKYSLSLQGLKYVAENIWGMLSDIQKENLTKFKQQINTISLDSLLRYVYNKYPNYTDKSIIADKYMNDEVVF
jgi:uncharacterized protein YwgA